MWAGGAVLVLLIIGGMTAWKLMLNDIPADPSNAAQVALGKVVYAENCASCHGASLEGQPNWRERKSDGRMPAPPHDASGHTWHHPVDVLFSITKEGLGKHAPLGYQSDMPAFGETLTDEQIWAVLAFIANSWPEDIQARWALVSQQSEK
jgi:mono/diheme cytochrome c family protein